MSEIQIQLKNRILSGIEGLPSLSPAVQEIIVISNDLTASPKDLLDIIRTDPVLTAKILRLVNSAYFSLNNQVVSLNRALVLLGFNTIKNIAISTEFVKLSKNSPHNKYFDYHELWEHMVSVGAAGKFIASESGENRKVLEEYFIAGLIHDLGDFLLMRFLPEEFFRVRNFALEKKMAVRDCARKVLGFSSGEMGVELAKHWKLQDHLQKVISRLEDPSKLCEGKLEKVVMIADKFCRAHAVGYVSDEIYTEITDKDLAEIGLSPQFFEEKKVAMMEAIEKAKVFIT
jgi:HD-like signal output (HDOD) protein